MEKAIEALRNGGIILYPTDTTWALGCDATNEEACNRILELLTFKPKEGMTLLADNFPMIERYIPDFPEVCYDLVDLTEKPLTIVYPKAKGIAESILGVEASIGFRITEDPHCLKLIRSIRKPILAAEIPSEQGWLSRKYSDIPKVIREKADAIVNERQHDKMKPLPQVIQIGLRGEVKIIRQ
jgi:L-threonylcarbamoyladenylate synthase